MSNLRLVLLLLLSLLPACDTREPLVEQAKAAFAARYPEWKIVNGFVGERSAAQTNIRIQYLHTPAASFPSQTSVYEAKLGYRKVEGDWVLWEVLTGRYIRPARCWSDGQA